MTRGFPERLLALIRQREGRYTTHAKNEAVRRCLDWPDVESVAASVSWWQSNRDEVVSGGYKYEMIGRDTYGRKRYSAGKEIEYYGERIWLVITIHEAD